MQKANSHILTEYWYASQRTRTKKGEAVKGRDLLVTNNKYAKKRRRGKILIGLVQRGKNKW